MQMAIDLYFLPNYQSYLTCRLHVVANLTTNKCRLSLSYHFIVILMYQIHFEDGNRLQVSADMVSDL